jgi:hypothetical protein
MPWWLAAMIVAVSLIWDAATAQPNGDFVDPKTLLPEADDTAARRGWPILNRESEEDWLERLRQSPPKVIAAYLVWSAEAPRAHDFQLVLCLSRLLQTPERGFQHVGLNYSIQVDVHFTDGPPNGVELSSFYFGYDRCTSIEELHPRVGRTRSFSAEADIRFRPDKIKSVAVTMRRTTAYGEKKVAQSDLLTPSFYVNPTRQTKDGPAKVTREFISGRAKGEAMRSTKRCTNIAALEEIRPPAESDRSDYAQGFARGWELAGDFLTVNERCNELPEIFEIKQVGIGPIIRSVSKCPPWRPQQVSLAAECVRFDQ